MSLSGAKNRWKYLATLYSTTIIVNLLLFMVIFPMVTANLYSGQSNTQTNTALLQAADNVGTNNIAGVSDSTTASNVAASTDSTITLRVDIPCPGHAALISEELKKLVGVNSIDYNFPNTFKVGYDASKVTKSQILGIDVFKSYPATVLSEDVFPTTNTATAANPEQSAPSTSGSCGGGCGGGCGGSGSSCGASGSSCGGSSGGCGSGSSNSYGGSTCGGKVY